MKITTRFVTLVLLVLVGSQGIAMAGSNAGNMQHPGFGPRTKTSQSIGVTQNSASGAMSKVSLKARQNRATRNAGEKLISCKETPTEFKCSTYTLRTGSPRSR